MHIAKCHSFFNTVLFTLCFLFSSQIFADHFNVTLLGTGNPDPQAEQDVERFGPSVLVEVAGKKLLFDAGRGVAIRLRQHGVTARELDAVFVSHMHIDHISDLDDLWLTGWGLSPFGRRANAFKLYGPQALKGLMQGLAVAYSTDIELRKKVEKPPLEGLRVDLTPIEPGLIYEQDDIKVTAFYVDHGPIKPAFGFKIEYQGTSAVISGDTTYSENLIKHAKGSDLLIHEVAAARPTLFKKFPPAKAIYSVHSSPEDVTKVLLAAKPKVAVLTHIIALEAYSILPLSTEEILAAVKSGYSGDVQLGKDLMQFELL